MNRFGPILPFLMASLLLVSCAHNRVPDGKPAELRQRLEAGQAIERSDPFLEREFSPYLDGSWIGRAVSYGCYREGQAPGVKGPSKEEILEDLNLISRHWNLIRVYNADDDTQRILEVIREHGLPLRMMLGIWLENETGRPEARAANIANVLRGIRLANAYRDIVIAVNVGNETQVYWSWHRMEGADLIRYLRAVRANTQVPVTTADDYNFWNKPESRALAEEVDFIVTHAYPLWNGKTLDEAIPWLDQTLAAVKAVHPAKQVILGEIGWATNYNPDKKGDGEQGTLVKGEVGEAAQESFLLRLDAWIERTRTATFLFEAFDEPWKGGGEASGPNEIEKNWGVFHADRTPKQSFINHTQKQGR
jgi:exo-beta-1,3-glucanase (GH17 family)